MKKLIKIEILLGIILLGIIEVCLSEEVVEAVFSNLENEEDYSEAITEVTDESLVYFETTTASANGAYTNTDVDLEETTTQTLFSGNLLSLDPVTRRPPIKRYECGVPKVKKSVATRIIGGQPAFEGEFPWFAAITKFQHNKQPRWKVICGAVLISGDFAATAAHCLHNRFKDTLQLAFNVKDINNLTTDSNVIKRRIKNIISHPNYDPQTQHNDIALIQFKMPINFRTETKAVPICLPSSPSDFQNRNNGTFAGFGHTSYGSSYPGPKENSRILMKISVPILTHADCLKTKVPSKKNITESMVCAGTQGKDACINDSGGGLMVQERGRTVLVGLASWGIGCALPDYPGVYTRVTHFLEWIKRTASL